MIRVPFNVNDARIRRDFLKHSFMEALCSLNAQARAQWGGMSAQHMVEHLLWTFEFSTGDTDIHRDVPPAVSERMKAFLYDNRPTPREYKNPLLGETPPSFRFSNLEESRQALQKALNRFFDLYTKNPNANYDHPLFGPLNGEEWERALFKHCYHHLLQFGIIETENGV